MIVKNSLGGTGDRFSDDMQIPYAGVQHPNGKTTYTGVGSYWSSSPIDNNYYESQKVILNSNNFDARDEFHYSTRGYGLSVRCFKNSYVPRPKILNLVFMSDGEEV